MTSTLLRTALTAALLAAVPAYAAAPVTKKAPSARMETLKVVAKEIAAPFNFGAGNPIPRLDKLVRQPHSPATSARLMASFGIPALVTLNSAPAAPGMLAYALAMPARQLAEVDGETMQWAALESTLELDAAGRNLTWNASWPSFTLTDPEASITLSDMSMASTQQRTGNNLWIGNAAIKIAHMAVAAKDKSADVAVEDITIVATVAERGKVVDVGYDVKAKAFKVAGDQADNFVLRMRVSNVDFKTMEAFNLKTSVGSAPLASNDIFGGNKKEFIAFARNAAARGTRLEIDELSASFHGHKITSSGSVSLAPVRDADFKTAAAFAKKVIARFDVQAPVGLVTEIAAIVTRKQALAKGQQISDEAVAQTSMMITDGMVAKLTSSGYVTLRDGVLTATIVFKGGKLSVNGKPVAIPKTK